MTTLSIHTPDGSTQGTVDLPADLFDVPANTSLMHQVVVAQLAARRAGTHKTKNRGEVSGGGAKPYRQKGTGRARQGSTRAPQFEGGGVVHGPTPRDYSQRTPKKMKAAALRGALSDRAREGLLHVVTTFVPEQAPSTRSASSVLDAVLADAMNPKRVLVVVEPDDVVSWKSLRNLSSVHLLDTGQLNTYDVLVSDAIVFTEAALASYVARAEKKTSRRTGGSDLSTELVSGGAPSMVLAQEADPAVEETDGPTTDPQTDTEDAT